VWDNNVLDVSPLGATGVEPVFVAVTGVTDIAWSADGSQLVCHTTGATVTLSAGTWTPAAPQSPPALAPAWHWSLQMFMATSSTYLAGSTTAVVSQIDGVTVLTPTSSNTFKVAGAGNFRACVGVGFLSDNSTLLFSMRHERGWELLALDTRTWRVGHVGDGVMCVLENDEYAVPFTRD
jgi:hypothetical protein